jgi:hypothetical protein
MPQELPGSSSSQPPHVRRFEHQEKATTTVSYPGVLLGYKEVSDEKKSQGCPDGRGEQ